MTVRDSRIPSVPITDQEVEQSIEAFFQQNYKFLKLEGGHELTRAAKVQAMKQALYYWKRLREIAVSVTETEVRLSLPGQMSPKKRRYVIEGVVDIVRAGKQVLMYDLKTHPVDEVRASQEFYEAQLNVYAHIWKGIRRQRLDGTYIIATGLPKALSGAILDRDSGAVQSALEAWQPLVKLAFNEKNVAKTIEDFGRCVDEIEDGKFSPPTQKYLSQPRLTGRRKVQEKYRGRQAKSLPTIAETQCTNCDARFSCQPYLSYQANAPRGRAGRTSEDEAELDEWIDANAGS